LLPGNEAFCRKHVLQCRHAGIRGKLRLHVFVEELAAVGAELLQE
jgi:hypothetical protein